MEPSRFTPILHKDRDTCTWLFCLFSKLLNQAFFIQLFIFRGFSDRLESFCHVQVARQTMSAFH